ncbi:hypothetical protein SRABI83_04530 [Arthrobacter sp. Bi83]|nr:hypothetical protein SRABI83_04530 [Arthrobacter sp. Bi83]
MPPGVLPDVFDGSSWVGLVAFRMQGASLGRGPAVPYFGDFTEVNVRLYSCEPGGRRGVVFLSLDASRFAVLLAARAVGIPYVWSHAHVKPGLGPDPAIGYSVRRFRHGAETDFAVTPDLSNQTADPLAIHLTARFGLHTRLLGRTIYVPNTHTPWPLHRAKLTVLDDQLVAAAGITVSGTPESVLFSPGVGTRFGLPRPLA